MSGVQQHIGKNVLMPFQHLDGGENIQKVVANFQIKPKIF